MTDDIRFESQDSQGLTVWERLDACDRAILQLTGEVTALVQQYAQMQNDLSLLPSIQRAHMDLEKRLTALESEAPTLYGFGEPLPKRGIALATAHPVAYVPFGSTGKLVEQVESMFECKNGDHRRAHSVWDELGGFFVEYPYVVVGLLAPTAIPDAQEQLRQAMYTSFFKLRQTCKSERPVLYWRYAEQERIQEETEQAPGSSVPVRYKIMTRIAIPEADYSVVEALVKPSNGPYATLQG
jgi:hypothetical protein